MKKHQLPQTVVASYPYLELDNQGQIVRFQLDQERHVIGRDKDKVDLLLPQDWQLMSRCHAVLHRPLGKSDYRIYDGDQKHPSTNGLFLNHTRVTPSEGLKLKDHMVLKIGQSPKNQILLKYVNPLRSQPVITGQVSAPLSLKTVPVVLGRDPNVDLRLDDPTISRYHATISSDGQGSYLLKDHSANGVHINDKKVSGSKRVANGATIRIGPFILVRREDTLLIWDQGSQMRLEAHGLVRCVSHRQGSSHRLLDDISLAIEPGQLVGLVGGSGAGKSTLMRTLLGISPLTEGQVLLNGDDLHQNFSLYRHQIGYVPQDDIIHYQLTVLEVLTFAAQLRLPPDADRAQLIRATLTDVEMTQHQNIAVSALSGGQRKRVSIAVELLSNPRLFFLDEPTSGLDPGLDKKMMQLLRKLADQGRSIILVTHATSNINLCDRIAFLGRGGRLCYFGPPQEALGFFEITTGDFADIYTELEQGEHNVYQWCDRFLRSSEYQRYIKHHLSSSNIPIRKSISLVSQPTQTLRQLKVLTQRYFKLMQRDPVSIGLGLITAILCPALMALAITNENPLVRLDDPTPTSASIALRVLFVFACAAIWVGLSSALQEIIKEAAIYLRERLINLAIIPYVASKILGLGALAIIQTVLITATVLIAFRWPEAEIISWPLGLGITTLLTLVASFSLGLLVSAFAKNSSQANSALPLLLIPQIIFSGVLFSDLEGITKVLSWAMISRWAVGAYGAIVNINAMIPEPMIGSDGNPLPQPLSASSNYDPTWENLLLNWVMLGLQIAVCLSLTLWLQKRKDVL